MSLKGFNPYIIVADDVSYLVLLNLFREVTHLKILYYFSLSFPYQYLLLSTNQLVIPIIVILPNTALFRFRCRTFLINRPLKLIPPALTSRRWPRLSVLWDVCCDTTQAGVNRFKTLCLQKFSIPWWRDEAKACTSFLPAFPQRCLFMAVIYLFLLVVPVPQDFVQGVHSVQGVQSGHWYHHYFITGRRILIK